MKIRSTCLILLIAYVLVSWHHRWFLRLSIKTIAWCGWHLFNVMLHAIWMAMSRYSCSFTLTHTAGGIRACTIAPRWSNPVALRLLGLAHGSQLLLVWLFDSHICKVLLHLLLLHILLLLLSNLAYVASLTSRVTRHLSLVFDAWLQLLDRLWLTHLTRIAIRVLFL